MNGILRVLLAPLSLAPWVAKNAWYCTTGDMHLHPLSWGIVRLMLLNQLSNDRQHWSHSNFSSSIPMDRAASGAVHFSITDCVKLASLDCPRLYMSSMIGVKSIGYLRCSAITMSVPVGNWSLLSQLVLPMGLVQDQVINALHSNMCILVTRVWAIGHHTSIPQKAEERTVCSTQLKYPQCNHHAMDVLHSYWNPYDSRGLGRAVAMLAAGTMVHNDFPFLPPFLLISRRFIPGFAFSP